MGFDLKGNNGSEESFNMGGWRDLRAVLSLIEPDLLFKPTQWSFDAVVSKDHCECAAVELECLVEGLHVDENVKAPHEGGYDAYVPVWLIKRFSTFLMQCDGMEIM